MPKSLTYVEIDIDRCALAYGSSPCKASIPDTGERKCFNSLGTCQDRDNFDDEGVTIRFAVDASYLPGDVGCIPCLTQIDFTPSIVSLGVDLGQRASVKVTMRDHRDSDTGPAGDPYLADRDYDPFKRGTYFGKFKVRHPYLRGRKLRLIRGELGQALGDMETRHFIIDSFDGPLPDGSFSITAKDVLKLADGDRAQAPRASNGFLTAGINSSATALTLSPSGIGNADNYPTAGHVAVGGKEIMKFTRDPNAGLTANTVLLMHFNGSDAATSMTDSSGNGRNGSAGGNAQLDTGQVKFGTTSLLLDGSGDSVTIADGDHWTFAGNFTVDCWIMVADLAGIMNVFSQATDNNNHYRLRITTNGAIGFAVTSAASAIISLASAASVIVPMQWQHVALTRSGNVFRLFVDGVQVATTTDADAIPNYTGLFRIGGNADGATEWFKGWIDEFRIQSNAWWTADFSDNLPVQYEDSSDKLVITRAQHGTAAVAHDAQDRVQLCLHYDSVDPANIQDDLLQSYADVPSEYIPIDAWLDETGSFFDRLFTALIPEPTPVSKLLSEVIEQAALAMWWDDRTQTIPLQVLRAISTLAARYSEENTLESTIQSKEQPDKRISEVWIYFGQINPLKPVDDADNYRSLEVVKDDQSAADYGSPAIKKIYSRWIPPFGRTIATRLGQIILGRYKNPPRRINLDQFRDGVNEPTLGQGGRVEAWFIQDDTGAPADVPVQVTRVNPEADRFKIEFEEMLFDVPDGIDDRTIIIDADTLNFNLRTVYEDIYGAPKIGDEVVCIVQDGVIVGSGSTASPAFDTGTWPTQAATGNRTSGSPIITGLNLDANTLKVGMAVTGAGLGAKSRILTIDSSSQITLDKNATSGTSTSTSLTIHTVILTLTDNGRILGRGGNGGRGGRLEDVGGNIVITNGQNGFAGGLALKAQYPIAVDGSGQVGGGGGGGGGGYIAGGGGGGGQGRDGGAGGARGFSDFTGNGVAGAAGTADAAGNGGNGYAGDTSNKGGNGGALGQAGSIGLPAGGSSGLGGAAGNAIDGDSFITESGSLDVQGSRVN